MAPSSRVGLRARPVRRSPGWFDGRGRPRGRVARTARWRVVHCRSRPLRVAARDAPILPAAVVLLLVASTAAVAAKPGDGSVAEQNAQTIDDPDPGPQRLPRPARTAGPVGNLRRSHRQPDRHRPGSGEQPVCRPPLRSGRRRRVPGHPRAHPARGQPQHRVRVRRRHDRRDAAAVGALPRRADDRGLQPDGPRLQQRRQPRVRRRRRRAASDAERRLPPGRRLRRRRRLRRGRLRLPGRQRCLQDTGEDDLPALRVRHFNGVKVGVRGHDARGHAAHRHARLASPPSTSSTRRRPSTLSCRS